MPVKVDTKCGDCTAAQILLPIGVTGLGWYLFSRKKEQQEWFEKLKKPNWYTTNPAISATLDLAVVAPIGYAARLALKEARGDDRRLALALYGASLLGFSVITIPTFMYTKDIKLWAGVTALTSGLFGATAFSFYKVNNTAGLLLIPAVAWFAYGAIGLFAMAQANPTEKPK